MSEKQRILKANIDKVFDTSTFKQYITLRDQIYSDPQFVMYVYVVENREFFSRNVYDTARIKIIKKKTILKTYTKEIDKILNELLSLYESE